MIKYRYIIKNNILHIFSLHRNSKIYKKEWIYFIFSKSKVQYLFHHY